MADSRLRSRSDILPLRFESGKLFIPEDLAAEVLNFYLTEEGTLRSVWGPCPYVPPQIIETWEYEKSDDTGKKRAPSYKLKQTLPDIIAGTNYFVDHLPASDQKDRLHTLNRKGKETGKASRASNSSSPPPPSTSGPVSSTVTSFPSQSPRPIGGAPSGSSGHGFAVPAVAPTLRSTLHYPFYEEMHSIFHARLDGGTRDLLLVQTGDQIWVLDGWQNGTFAYGNTTPWRIIAMSDTSVLPTTYPDVLQTEIQSDLRPRPPTQFERTPAGIVIIPRGETATPLFYDGGVILPLGYASRPSPPTGLGPRSPGTAIGDVNTKGFQHQSSLAAWPDEFGHGRLGYIASALADDDKFRLEASRHIAKTQWVDRWGNLSPLSGPSNPITIDRTVSFADLSEGHLKAFQWSNIEPGPTGTIGRLVHRTLDLEHSGSAEFFEIPANAAGGFLSYATVPDNISTILPDNVPDSWMNRLARKPVAVEPFRLYKVAFGRGWAANFRSEPGKLHPTMVGRWGTFLEGEELYPDPRGAEITGIYPVSEGLLVFTEVSTFLITENADGDGFRTNTINSSVGCIAPSSIVTMPSGEVIWLGREGFYAMGPERFGLISEDISRTIRDINFARGVQATAAFDPEEKKYRCWVTTGDSTRNNLCLMYDGRGWTRRDDVLGVDVCVTDDHRKYMLAVGQAVFTDTPEWLLPAETVSTLPDYHLFMDGVWVLDHEILSLPPSPRVASITTAWLRAPHSDSRASPVSMYIWLRETEESELVVEVMRDWRNEVIHTETVKLFPPDDVPPFWGPLTENSADYAGKDRYEEDNIWVRRRPYWTKVDLDLSSVETFRVRLSHTGDWEFLGISFDEIAHGDGFRSAPK